MNVAAYIAQRARAVGLDPQAVLAIARQEGLSGRVGDHGTSFGPFQLHQGGALPKNIPLGQAQRWAESPAGINYALSRINQVAHGLHGAQAVSAISQRFERPANPAAEIAGALKSYGHGVGGSPALTVANLLRGGGGGAAPGGMSPQQLMGQFFLQTANAELSGQPNAVGQEGQGLLQLAMARKALAASQPATQGITTSPKGLLTVSGASGAPEDMAAVKTAEKYLGTPYVWGGDKPGGFDCSGLLQYVWGKNGVNIPRTSQQQFHAGRPVNVNNLQAGDAVFFEPGPGGPGHVAMYIGNGKVIQAPHTGTDVQISPLNAMGPIMGARSFG